MAHDSTMDGTAAATPATPFAPSLFPSVLSLQTEYSQSTPYHHAVIHQLFDGDFLAKARDEIVDNVSFSHKETDIYRISQTGDLTNLSGLPAAELAVLPTLLSLRNSLYSPEFRSFLSTITGCGPLSGIKTDMSCAEYSKGSYLLNHDDVIGTRRVSFILYLVRDEQGGWKREWGGALELYPVLPADPLHPERPNVPHCIPTVSIPPAFNQFTFFAVQPGHSFHSVEEVVVHPAEVDGKRGGIGSRLSLSGWFHAPVEGEEGYVAATSSAEEDAAKGKSSLQQLYSTTLAPSTSYANDLQMPLPTTLMRSLIPQLALVNPSYLSSKTLSHLRNEFVETSQLVLSKFLRSDIASELEKLLRAKDVAELGGRRSEVGGQTVDLIPAHTTGLSSAWEATGPPHIQRFLSLTSTPSSDRLTELLQQISALFASSAFRSLLSVLTSLAPRAHTIATRRFRPGLDYTLARGEEVSDGDAKLDVGLGLTPEVGGEDGGEDWEDGEVGAWELWIVGEMDGDEATYSGAKAAVEEGDEEEEDDGPLLALPPTFNTLSIVLRDPGVLKFVKYVGAAGRGSRWDIGGEWEVDAVEEDSDEDEAY